MTHDHQAHHKAAGTPADQAHPVNCDEALDKLFDLLDGELDGSFEARLRAHVGRCNHCTDVAEFERRFLEVLHTVRGEEKCPKSLRDRVLATLRAEGLEA